jgi:hypothetical protein
VTVGRLPDPDPAAPAVRGGVAGSSLVGRFLEVVPTFDRLPLPGHGATWERFETLASLAEDDLALARLAEGHADALAILDESGRELHHPRASYGVWAARGASGGVTAEPAGGGWELAGCKPFCSGSGLVERALITAEAPDGYRLFDVPTADIVVGRSPDSWPAVGMAGTLSETLVFEGRVSDDDAVGPPGFYTRRPGFWFGACGVAACWYGGARGLMAGTLQSLGAEPAETTLMELGRMAALLQAMTDTLTSAATAIDLDPEDRRGRARGRALAVRQVVHSSCESVLGLTAAAGGARPLCHDADQARRAADLYVYLAQHHGGPDAVELGRLAVLGEDGTGL